MDRSTNQPAFKTILCLKTIRLPYHVQSITQQGYKWVGDLEGQSRLGTRALRGITKTCPCNIHIFLVVKIENFHQKFFDIFLIFAQNIEAVLPSTHNLCFGAKIKIGIPLHTPVLLYKSGV